MSLSAGIAIGYVFLYLLPKISLYTAARITSDPGAPEMFHFGLYALALIGTLVYVTYYRLLMRDTTTRFPVAVATLMALFYYFLIGYLITNVPRQGSVVYVVIGLVFVLHSLGTNH